MSILERLNAQSDETFEAFQSNESTEDLKNPYNSGYDSQNNEQLKPTMETTAGTTDDTHENNNFEQLQFKSGDESLMKHIRKLDVTIETMSPQSQLKSILNINDKYRDKKKND